MNKLTTLFKNKKNDLLSIYLTAGYPNNIETLKIAQQLDKSKVDFIELGMPFSDPLADGPVIQETSKIALKNGMNFNSYFKLATQIHETTALPIVFMGYYNQVLKIGVAKFCELCNKSGISALIIPDLPIEEYETDYKKVFEKHNLTISFLITPNTETERVKKIIALCSAFVYVVSDNSITGNKATKNKLLNEYLIKIKDLKPQIPAIVGFGIHDKKSYDNVCKYLNGAIIGSAFLKSISLENPVESSKIFIESIK